MAVGLPTVTSDAGFRDEICLDPPHATHYACALAGHWFHGLLHFCLDRERHFELNLVTLPSQSMLYPAHFTWPCSETVESQGQCMASLRVRTHDVLPTFLFLPELIWLHTKAGTKSNKIIHDAVGTWASAGHWGPQQSPP